MNIQTEVTIKSILAVDDTVNKNSVDHAIRLIRGEAPSQPEVIQTLKFEEVAKLLCVSRSTIKRYANSGALERIYGCGTKQALGISLSSYNRFIATHSYHDDPRLKARLKATTDASKIKASTRRANRERLMRKIRLLISIPSQATRKQKYDTIKAFLSSTNEYSANLVCKALGITLSAYCHYQKRPKEPWAAHRKVQSTALLILRANHPDLGNPIGLHEAHRLILNHGISISIASIAKILDTNGFTRKRRT